MDNGSTISVTTHSDEETRSLGARLGELLERGDILLLHGDLGTGKTRLAQGIARGLGVRQPVTSPSFVLMNEYDGREALFHVDLYRLDGAEDLDELGLWDYAERGVLVLEWPERGAGVLPGDGLAIELSYGHDEESRDIVIRARGPRGDALAREIGANK